MDLAHATDSAFNPFRENMGMFVVGLIVLVMWLIFRRLLKWAEEKKS